MRCEPAFVRERARSLRGSRAARWGRRAARDGEPRFRARDPHVRRRPMVARHEGCAPSALCARRSRDFFPARGAGVRVVGHWQPPRRLTSPAPPAVFPIASPTPPRTVTDLSHRLARPCLDTPLSPSCRRGECSCHLSPARPLPTPPES